MCEVVQPAIRGRDVTLMCRMTYDWQAQARQFNAPPRLRVSVSWADVDGTTVSNAADPTKFRGTVETSMTLINVMQATILPHSCSIQFDFSPGSSPLYQYANNSVSATCVTEPTTVWGKYRTPLLMLSFVN